MRWKFLSIGLHIHVAEEGEFGMLSRTLTHEDCAILISYSGNNVHRNPMALVDIFKRNRVPMIAITSGGHNYLQQNIDCVFELSAQERLYSKISNFASEQSLLFILNVIFACYFQKDYSKNLTYKIEDHLKQIGIGVSKKVRFLRTVTTFKTMIPSYSSIKAQSLKIKIPASFKGKLGIYEGYNGAMIGDCTLLKNIDLSGYNDGNHLFALERKASGGSVTLLIYNKEGSIVKEFNIL